MARKRHQQILDLRKANPHGIYVDDMRWVHDTLHGFSALTDPETILLTIADIGPDWHEARSDKPVA